MEHTPMEKFLLNSHGGIHWAQLDSIEVILEELRPMQLLQLHICRGGNMDFGAARFFHWNNIQFFREDDAIAFAEHHHNVIWPVSLSLLGMAMWVGDPHMFKKIWAHVDGALPPEDCTLAELEDGDFVCASDLLIMYHMNMGINVDHDQFIFLFGGKLAVAEEVTLFLDRAYLTSALHHLELISTKVAIRALKNLDKPRHPCLTNVPRGWDMSPLQKARLLVDQQVGPFPASCPRPLAIAALLTEPHPASRC